MRRDAEGGSRPPAGLGRAWARSWLTPATTPLPALVLALGAAAGLASIVAVRSGPAQALLQVLPVDDASPDPLLTAVTGVGLLALALGLRRGKRLAWWFALVTFASALIAQLALAGHVAGAALAALCLVLLAVDRRRYVVATDRAWRRWALVLLVPGAIGLAAETAVAMTALAPLPSPIGGVTDAAETIASWLAFAGSEPAAGLAGHGVLLGAALALVRLPMILAAVGILAPVEEPEVDDDLRDRAASVGQRFGQGALLPFQLGRDKRFALAAGPGGSDGLVVYGRTGRFAVVLGDPIGAPVDAWAAFEAFVAKAGRRDEVVAVYQASGAARAALIASGFRLFRIGHEAVVDLAGFDLAGSRRANLRHTVTRARRGGVVVRWYPKGIGAPAADGDADSDSDDAAGRLAKELAAIDAAWRARNGPELGFTIGRFDPDEVRTIPVSVALDSDGSPIAFATFRPTGRDGGMVLDLMRRLPGGVPGALESCIAEAALGMREAGITCLSLGLAPLAGLEREDALREERALATAARLVRPWYDVRGLEFFKAKFDPRWEPRYVAVRGRRDLVGLSIALLRLHLGGFRGAIARALVRRPRA